MGRKKVALPEPHLQTRREYFIRVARKTNAHGEARYKLPWFPRRTFSWQTAWDWAGYHREFGHYNLVRGAMQRGEIVYAGAIREYPCLKNVEMTLVLTPS